MCWKENFQPVANDSKVNDSGRVQWRDKVGQRGLWMCIWRRMEPRHTSGIAPQMVPGDG